MAYTPVILCDDIDKALENYRELGYRLDMILPADSPREALISSSQPSAIAHGSTSSSGQRYAIRLKLSQPEIRPPASASGKEWSMGRAGMEYRDLVPDRSDGKVIASHIRLTEGGEVEDYVHYHKIDFQMIYCLKGRVKVVYEDQGLPFWLERGDCILQPPEIRHRVLRSSAGAEVVEVSSPAEHETWVEHDIKLPTTSVDPSRLFNGQRFLRHVAAGKDPDLPRDLGIGAATNGKCEAIVQRLKPDAHVPPNVNNAIEIRVHVRLSDRAMLAVRLRQSSA